MPTFKVTMAVVAFFHLSAVLISKPIQALRRAVETSGSLCVDCADDGPLDGSILSLVPLHLEYMSCVRRGWG